MRFLSARHQRVPRSDPERTGVTFVRIPFLQKVLPDPLALAPSHHMRRPTAAWLRVPIRSCACCRISVRGARVVGGVHPCVCVFRGIRGHALHERVAGLIPDETAAASGRLRLQPDVVRTAMPQA